MVNCLLNVRGLKYNFPFSIKINLKQTPIIIKLWLLKVKECIHIHLLLFCVFLNFFYKKSSYSVPWANACTTPFFFFLFFFSEFATHIPYTGNSYASVRQEVYNHQYSNIFRTVCQIPLASSKTRFCVVRVCIFIFIGP